MVKIFAIIFCLLAGGVGYALASDSSSLYLKKLSDEEISLALQQIKLNSCQEFKELYFQNSKNDMNMMMQATAYDIGLCVDQDLKKSAELYEQSFKVIPFAPNASLRLFLIYQFGPETVMNEQRAEFFSKQAVISLAIMRDKDQIRQAIRNVINHQIIPHGLEENLVWIYQVLAKSEHERKGIANILERQGYQNTDSIWPFAEDFDSMKIEK